VVTNLRRNAVAQWWILVPQVKYWVSLKNLWNDISHTRDVNPRPVEQTAAVLTTTQGHTLSCNQSSRGYTGSQQSEEVSYI